MVFDDEEPHRPIPPDPPPRVKRRSVRAGTAAGPASLGSPRPPADAENVRCPRCDHPARDDDLACGLCGEVLRRPAARIDRFAPPPAPRAATPDAPVRRPRLGGRWTVLGVGVFLAPVLTLTPILRYMGWFLGSLCHETGHVAAAWAVGCPAFPAIRLDGHAAALHREQQPLLVALAVAGLLAFAWASRRRPARRALAVAALVAYPVVALTGVREGFFLLAGHLGELAFACVFVVRGLDGGFSGSFAERCAHTGVAAYLVGRNAALALGLLASETAREAYGESGSFGLVNDLLRFSREVLATSSVAPGAWTILVACLVPVALGIRSAARPGDA